MTRANTSRAELQPDAECWKTERIYVGIEGVLRGDGGPVELNLAVDIID